MELLTLDYESNRHRIRGLASKVMFMNLDKLRSLGFRQRLMDDLTLRVARWRATQEISPTGCRARLPAPMSADFDKDELAIFP